MYEYGYLSGGEWIDHGERFETHNPARPGERVGRYTATPPEAVAGMVRAADVAQRDWGARPPVERSRQVQRFLDAVEARAEAIAVAVTREQGKPLAEARGETGKSLREARFMAGEAARPHSEVMPGQRPGMRNLVLRRPRGVIAAVTPWNFPVLTPMRKIAPALTFGNAIVLKPSEFTPAAAAIIAEAALETLPPGLLQLLHGGAGAGTTLVSDPGVHGVTFTGSVATGRRIYAAAAANLAEVSLELGGKNAVVINDSDDLDGCLDQVVGAANQCAGQRCTAISRVIVREDLRDDVLRGLVARAEAERLGDGAVDGTTMGPLTNRDQLERVDAYVREGLEAGARALTGGRRAQVSGCEDGFFFEPTVLADVTPQMSVAREEIFGPVLSVLTYRDFDEALTILNGVEYGLTSALFSNDNHLVQRFLDHSQNGMMHVNHGTVPDDHMPFGGIRHSGVGAYSVGRSAVTFYTTEHSAYLRHA
ncbi:aldehyde dehydrogenase family protein [Arhodomonas aquaeolei]|uniref:aldehyde dehydrogenase family protein n=1 Tax=Arhodomonas aquaeolei TaxID=2369 RepID=UPI002167D637|nr:aldehyde dehydrogenase family protein [Arhodomonas aquaeolei]MCS4505363.1 aldehyde dehydrogenase family protein [Arhodomonas aquaeolei]